MEPHPTNESVLWNAMQEKCIRVDIAKAIMVRYKDLLDREPGTVQEPVITLARRANDAHGNLEVYVSLMFNRSCEYNTIICSIKVKDDYPKGGYEREPLPSPPPQQ